MNIWGNTKRGESVNINFDTDTRHDVSRKVLKKAKEVMYQSDDAGVEEYGTPLESGLHYNWMSMGFDELFDALKYFQCEQERKQQVIDILEKGINEHNPTFYMELALHLLKIGGTGK